MLLHFVLELLCSIILATDTSWHSASLNLGSAQSRHSRARGRPGGWGWQEWRSGESTRLPPMWPAFDSRSRCHMWVEFVVGLVLAPRVFRRVLRFSSLHKNQHFQIPIRPGRRAVRETTV